MKYNYIFKINLVGEPAVGKTACLIRYVKDTFTADYLATLGANFLVKHLEVDGKQVLILTWDIAGHARFARYARGYWTGTSAFIFLYDITRRETFARIGEWIRDARSRGPQNFLMAIAGNKLDLIEDPKYGRDMPKKEVREAVQRLSKVTEREYKYPVKYYEVSAKTGEGLDRLFSGVVEDVIHYLEHNEAG